MKKKDWKAHFCNSTEFHNLEDLRPVYHLRPLSHRTSDQAKLEKQREKFLGTCFVCGKPLTHISGTNVLVCMNPDCKGEKIELPDGSEFYKPVNRVLNEKGSQIAEALFD